MMKNVKNNHKKPFVCSPQTLCFIGSDIPQHASTHCTTYTDYLVINISNERNDWVTLKTTVFLQIRADCTNVSVMVIFFKNVMYVVNLKNVSPCSIMI